MSSILSQACLVCGGRGDGAHFGAREACRACAAFFRRTVSMDKEYLCRGNGNCEIEASIRCMCRSCRFNKCIEVGMQKENVQKRRDNHGPRCSHAEADSSSHTTPTMPSTVFISEDQGMPMLRRLHTHHMQVRAVRKVVHHGDEINHVPRAIQLHDVDKLNLKEIGVTADFILAAFPSEMSAMCPNQRKTLFQLFFPSMLILECGYKTSIGSDLDHIVLANMDYIDTRNITHFYTPDDPTKKVETDSAVSLYTPSFAYFKEHVSGPMARFGVDEYEFYGLITLMLWDFDHDKINADTRIIAETVRDQLLKELLFYYRYVKRYSDESLRLANLLMFLLPLQRMTRRFVEDIEVGRVFNIYKIDPLTYDTINLRTNAI